MAISFVNTAAGSLTTTGTQLTSGTFAITDRNLLVALVRGRVVSSMTDSAGNSYSKAGIGTDADTLTEEIWYAPNTSPTASSFVTANLVGGAGGEILVGQYAGFGLLPLDGFAGGNTAVDNGTIVTTAGSTLIVLGIGNFGGNTGNFSSAGPWTIRNSAGSAGGAVFGFSDFIASSANTYVGSLTDTGSGNKVFAIASFAAGTLPGNFMRMGRYW